MKIDEVLLVFGPRSGEIVSWEKHLPFMEFLVAPELPKFGLAEIIEELPGVYFAPPKIIRYRRFGDIAFYENKFCAPINPRYCYRHRNDGP